MIAAADCLYPVLEVGAVDTMVRRGHAVGEYAARRDDCERSASILGVATLREIDFSDLDSALDKLGDERLVKRTRHIVTENQRVLDTAAALERLCCFIALPRKIPTARKMSCIRNIANMPQETNS